MIEIVSSFTSIHDIVEGLAENYQLSFEDAANTLLQEKKTKKEKNEPMPVLRFIRELKHIEPEYRKFTRDKYNKEVVEWGFPELVITDQKTSIDTFELTLDDSGIGINENPKLPKLTECDDKSEALGVCILYALANPSLASKAQTLTSHWFPTQVNVEGIEHADFVELSKKYGFDEEKVKGFSCVALGAFLHIKRQQGKDKIEHPEEFAHLIKKPNQPKEPIESRAQQHLKPSRKIVGKASHAGVQEKTTVNHYNTFNAPAIVSQGESMLQVGDNNTMQKTHQQGAQWEQVLASLQGLKAVVGDMPTGKAAEKLNASIDKAIVLADEAKTQPEKKSLLKTAVESIKDFAELAEGGEKLAGPIASLIALAAPLLGA